MTELIEAIADAPAPQVTADLAVSADGTDVEITSYTDLLRIEVATARDALRLARLVTPRIAAALSAAGLTAELRVAGTRVAVLGADATPGPLGRRLGGIELRPRGALRSVLRVP